MRLSKLLNKLNICIDRADDYIFSATGQNLPNPNSKVQEFMVDLLTNHFSVDTQKRIVARQAKIDRRASLIASGVDVVAMELSSQRAEEKAEQERKRERIKERRERQIERENNALDPYEGFSWGGLEGEEAHTAMWNCD